MKHFIKASWQAPANVSALTSTRRCITVNDDFSNFNLGMHVGDNQNTVRINRRRLCQELGLKHPPIFIEQVHGHHCIDIDSSQNRVGDGLYTTQKDQALAIMTADCVPIVICDINGSEIAAIHAGWRGLLSGVIENSLTLFKNAPSSLMAWIGPAICQSCFEVGDEVMMAFRQKFANINPYFKPHGEKWLADLSGIAKFILVKQGIHQVWVSKRCTFEEKNSFYSYRRDSNTGRMATLIWLN